MQKLLLLIGLSLVFVSPAAGSGWSWEDAGFANQSYINRYGCSLHPLEGGSDKAGAVTIIVPDGGGAFKGGLLFGADPSDQNCPLSLCPGTFCNGYTFPPPLRLPGRTQWSGN